MEKNYHLEKGKNGKKYFWKATIKDCSDRKQDLDGSKTHLVWNWGQEGGKPQQRDRIYLKGKVKRTSWEQAELECMKMIKDKINKGYSFYKDSELIDDEEDDTSSSDEVVVPHVMLAQNLEKYPEMFSKGAHIMPKLDGIFCLANLATGKLWSRQRLPIEGLPHISEALLSMIKKNSDLNVNWIVGELYYHGWNFNKISGIIRGAKTRDKPEQKQIEFHVFDAIIPDLPFHARYAILKGLLSGKKQNSEIKLVDAVYVPSLKLSHKSMHQKITEQGYEGIMIHSDGGPGYQEDKRTKWLLKYKVFQQEEFICIEVNPSKHTDKKGEITSGSVLLKDMSNNVFSATPKWTENEKKQLWIDKENYIGKYATVTFFSKSDKEIPRFPILIGFRDADDM